MTKRCVKYIFLHIYSKYETDKYSDSMHDQEKYKQIVTPAHK